MALADVVIEIADEMERSDNSFQVQGWAKQLRRAVKAAEGATEKVDVISVAAQLERARIAQDETEKAQRLKRQTQAAEGLNEGMIYFKGGNLDGTMIQGDHNMPFGAKVPMPDREVYVYGEDRQLHFSKEETEKYRSK